MARARWGSGGRAAVPRVQWCRSLGEWVSCGQVHSVQVFRSFMAQDPALLRVADGPGRLGLFLQNVGVEVIRIKVDRDFSEGGDRFA